MTFPSSTKRRFGAVRLFLENGKRIRTVSPTEYFEGGLFFILRWMYRSTQTLSAAFALALIFVV